MRLESGWTRPADERVGVDVAGRVVAVGPGVTRFKAGDEVFGTSPGAFAEFSLASERRLALKPPALTFEQAAAVPVAAITALQGLRDKGAVRPGQRVLINGASGGVGTFAVQIAKLLGAKVTGVCSTRNVALVRSLGADEVIDYTRDDFTRGVDKYDVVLDLVGNRDLSEIRRVLTPTGTYVLIGGGGPNDGRIIGPFAKALGAAAYSAMYDQRFSMMLASIEPRDLELLGGWIAAGRVRPVIDRRYTLREVPDALRYLETGHARGKVIVLVRPTDEPTTKAALRG
jgi:NADPH:quinone reductase-like Zn-dependent oxidoreductase